MREPAEWMRPTDDRILELIREHGNLTLVAIADDADALIEMGHGAYLRKPCYH